MKLPEEDFAERRRRLATQIARQRTEFSEAYTRLAQPIRYAEHGLRGFGFLRSNPWIMAAVPAAVSIIKLLWTFSRMKKAHSFESPPRQAQTRDAGGPGFKKTVATLAGHGWNLFKLYRRIRPYFP
jgi:hypothetical protein